MRAVLKSQNTELDFGDLNLKKATQKVWKKLNRDCQAFFKLCMELIVAVKEEEEEALIYLRVSLSQCRRPGYIHGFVHLRWISIYVVHF